MRRGTTLAIIVPVYNEQYLVEASLRRLVLLGESELLDRIQVIVVDDGSSDRTSAVLERFRRSVSDFSGSKFDWMFLRHEVNRGKAAAIRTGLALADTELVAIHDADLEYHPQDLLKMVQVFFAEEADAVFGSRFLASQYRRVLFFRHELGNRLLTLLSNLVSDLNLTDMETCYKMVRTKLLQSIPLVSERFGIEPEITIKLAKRGARIFEVPIRYAGRTYQEGKKIGWKDGVKTLGVIARFAVSDRIYADHDGAVQMNGRLERAPRFTRWMADIIRPYIGESVLEIGAGTGTLALQLLPRTLYWASEVNPLYLDYLDTLTQNRPYLRVGYTDSQRNQSYPPEMKFDTVVGLNVIEHLADDLLALQNIRQALVQGGRAIVLVPAGPRLFGTLDKVLGHQRRYGRDQITALAERAGFAIEAVLPFNRVGAVGWWLNGKLLRRTSLGLWQIKLMNLLTPLLRRLDSWLPLPPLSWIAVLRNPVAVPGESQTGSDVSTEQVVMADSR
jgi:SAM-dependent methyltransferase